MDIHGPLFAALHHVVRYGSLDEVRRKVVGPEAQQWRDPHGRTLLFVAAQRGVALPDGTNVPPQVAVEMCRHLVQVGGIDVNIATPEKTLKQTALFFAARSGVVEVVRGLIELKAQVGWADMNKQTALFYGAVHAYSKVVELLLVARSDACHRDLNGQTAMFYAAKEKPRGKEKDQLIVMQYLLSSEKEDGGRKMARIKCMKPLGQTALFMTVMAGLYDACRVLLTASPEAVDDVDENGQTALFYASNRPSNRADLVELLLDHKADATLRDNNGDTALHYAAQAAQAECCQVLVNKGQADPYASNNMQCTPAAVVLGPGVQARPPGLVQLFQSFGGVHQNSRKRPPAGAPALAAPALKRRDSNLSAGSGQSVLGSRLAKRKPSVIDGDDGESDDDEKSSFGGRARKQGSQDSLAGANLAPIQSPNSLLASQGLLESPTQAQAASQLDSVLLGEFLTVILRGTLGDVRRFAEGGHDFMEKGPQGRNAIFYASMRQAHDDLVARDICKVCVEKGLQVHSVDQQKQTALFHAARQGLSSTVEYLLEAKADPRHVDDEGWTALHFAAGLSMPSFPAGLEMPRVTSALLEAKADVSKSGKRGFTPVIVAAARGRSVTLEQLIAQGADLTGVLKEAAGSCIPALVRAGCDVNAPIDENSDPGLPVIVAAVQLEFEKVTALVRSKADISLSEHRTGMTALHYIVNAAKGRPAQDKGSYMRMLNTVVKELDANPCVVDLSGKTAADHAGRIRWLDGQKTLNSFMRARRSREQDEKEAKLRAITDYMVSIQPVILNSPLEAVAKVMKDAGAVVRDWGPIASQQQHEKNGAKASAPALLHVAAERKTNALEVAKLLVEEALFEPSLRERLSGESALFRACAAGNADVALYLLDKRSNIHETDSRGTTPLFRAARANNIEVMRALLKAGASVSAKDNDGRAVLSHAAQAGCDQAIRELVSVGAEVNAKDSMGRSALFFAIAETRAHTARLLLAELGARPASPWDPPVKMDGAGNHDVFHMAAERGLPEIVNLLLLAKRTQESETQLIELAGTGHPSALDELLKVGLNVNAPGRLGLRALHRAAARTDGLAGEICKRLLEHKADPSLADDKKETPLFAAARQGVVEIVALLVAAKCNVGQANTSNETALFEAAKNGQTSVVKLLLENGAKADVKNRTAQTALFHASDRRLVELLIQHKCDPRERDMNQQTALFSAAATGRDQIVQLLLANGLEADARDSKGQSALHFVAGANVTRLLTRAGCAVDCEDSLNQQTPLAAAASRGDDAAVKVLLAAGADARRLDSRKYTPLLCACHSGASLEVVAALVREGFPSDAATLEKAARLAQRRSSEPRAPQGVHPYLAKVVNKHGSSAQKKLALRKKKLRRKFALVFDDPVTQARPAFHTQQYSDALSKLSEICPNALPPHETDRITRGPPIP